MMITWAAPKETAKEAAMRADGTFVDLIGESGCG